MYGENSRFMVLLFMLDKCASASELLYAIVNQSRQLLRLVRDQEHEEQYDTIEQVLLKMNMSSSSSNASIRNKRDDDADLDVSSVWQSSDRSWLISTDGYSSSWNKDFPEINLLILRLVCGNANNNARVRKNLVKFWTTEEHHVHSDHNMKSSSHPNPSTQGLQKPSLDAKLKWFSDVY
ncbi:hypothetical protein MKW98_029357 [Papaver atlanticum]|uniref:Uncharacterized protein n=1 Tax=Papaver atlanticum TaxID=357466 RepID=A0AAD4SIB3_9MAGN|nr:hypothetical protein MKW98_029357 [Papaver atlanticum]